MRATSFAVLSAAALATAAPCTSTPPAATVVIETSHVYVNTDALAAVSTLYLLGPDTATCTPYKAQDGTVNGGLPFTVGHPSLLSTNTVVVGSLVCKTT